MADLIVKFGRREEKHIAFSTSPPYFCFEADTLEAVEQKVDAALAFHREAQAAVRERQRSRETRLVVDRIHAITERTRQVREVA